MLLLAMLLQEHGEGAAATPFSLEPGLIIWTWAVFIALFFALRKFAWPAIIRLAEERERTIQRQLSEAEQANVAAQAALEEHKKLLDGAKDEASKLIAEAKLVSATEREQMLEKARRDQEQLLERAKREIEAERERAVTELRKEAVDLSLAAASRLIDAKLDDAANRKLVTEYLSSLEGSR